MADDPTLPVAPPEWKFLSSSFLSAMKYDPESLILLIRMTNGKTYDYQSIDQDTADGLENASSPGRYYNENIKGQEGTGSKDDSSDSADDASGGALGGGSSTNLGGTNLDRAYNLARGMDISELYNAYQTFQWAEGMGGAASRFTRVLNRQTGGLQTLAGEAQAIFGAKTVEEGTVAAQAAIRKGMFSLGFIPRSQTIPAYARAGLNILRFIPGTQAPQAVLRQVMRGNTLMNQGRTLLRQVESADILGAATTASRVTGVGGDAVRTAKLVQRGFTAAERGIGASEVRFLTSRALTEVLPVLGIRGTAANITRTAVSRGIDTFLARGVSSNIITATLLGVAIPTVVSAAFTVAKKVINSFRSNETARSTEATVKRDQSSYAAREPDRRPIGPGIEEK